ncbi:lipopolysaccharide biosynthesis protein [Shewanella sp. UCD-KL21]|uniref:lipopolysaccharide biosynthesis protein n=1 Tax=Shewanella sp. UCD-KL21 TaxID=1917164 RepID=UPI000970A854|nr:oligosaccharide flippase family protein [Shewanella sp. UCD-KL21]
MKTKLNLSLIYFSRIYMAIISIVLVPFLLRELGHEAYGLIGFFVVLQACLQVLDAGVGGVLTRQCVLTKHDAKSHHGFVQLFKKIILVFFIISVFISFLGYNFSDSIVNLWLNTSLDVDIASSCVALMCLIFSLRYLQGPFRSIILANEKHILLSTIDIIFTTITNPIALIFVYYSQEKILSYFYFQAVSSSLRLIVLFLCSSFLIKQSKRRLLSEPEHSCNPVKSDFKQIVRFGMQLSSLSILWVLVTQSDKLTLTSIMTLNDYALYSLAISAVSVVSIFGSPINQYLQPRLTSLFSASKFDEYSKIFENTYYYLAIVFIPSCFLVIYFGVDFISAWLGDSETANVVIRYVPWLFIGSVFTVFSNFCFLLLYSHGNLKWHTIFYSVFSIVIIILNVLVAKHYGADGSVRFYFSSSLFLLLFWSYLNFYKYFDNFIYVSVVKILPSMLFTYIIFYLADAFRFDVLLHDILFSSFIFIFNVATLYCWCFKLLPNIVNEKFLIKYKCDVK